MNYHISSSQTSFHNTITNEQLNQVIEAITDGRYSWACVLILRFVGYNPLHFIPQRTYSRLMKENRQVPSIPMSLNNDKSVNINSTVTDSISNHLSDSDCLENSPIKQTDNVPVYLETKIAELYRRQK